MRYLFIVFALLPTFGSSAQNANSVKKFPFQVLYAENAKDKNGQVLKSLDLVSVSDVLTVSENGTLSLIHYSGFPIETSGDTIIIIVKGLQDLIVDPGQKSNLYTSSPDLGRLFIMDSKLVKKRVIPFKYDCSDCESKLKIIYPPNFNMLGLDFKDDLCFTWMPNKSKSYRVEIKTMFEEPLDTIVVTSNELRLNNQEFKILRKEENHMLAFISDLENKHHSPYVVLKKSQLNTLEFPYACNLKKATFALMAGLYIETLSKNYLVEAEKYFELATELSDKSFYKEMLANFRKRTEK